MERVMMDSSPSKMNSHPRTIPPPLAGTKRPAPSLLPAFEPLSSSPPRPRTLKRARDSSPVRGEPSRKYPTPIPSSTTGILSSSPPRLHEQPEGRPSLQRTQSVLSERAPLSAVPSVTLPENGEVLRMGRSSNSSNHQLSANRLISRVHVEARYIAASMPLAPNKMEIKCLGWNGIKLHCQGRTWDLKKADTFTSETEDADIMMDVLDTRVLIAWPGRERKDSIGPLSSLWDEENSPSAGRGISAVNAEGENIPSSPVRRDTRLESPVSPTPAGPMSSNLANLFSDPVEPAILQVYEDAPSPKDADHEDNAAAVVSMSSTLPATSFASNPTASQSSELSEPGDDSDHDQDPDEENDPIVHSFGPFGSNITNRMATFTAGSPTRLDREASPQQPSRSGSEDTNQADPVPIINHVANQLAFSRLSSTPLSVIMNHLPSELKDASPSTAENRVLTKSELRRMLNAAPCIGEIHREGKDAAGKALESEYYYIPDEDRDEARRAVVQGMRKPSLRNCRKQHKQYYWKRPKTP